MKDELFKERMVKGKDLVLKVKVKPKANKNKIVGTMADGTLKIDIAAPPEKGKANLELVKFLAKEWKTDKKNIKMISGKTDKNKLIKINQS